MYLAHLKHLLQSLICSSFCWLNVNVLVLIHTLQWGTERSHLTVQSPTMKLLQEESAALHSVA